MPLHTLEALLSSATFRAMGTANTVAVTEPDALPAALLLVTDLLANVDATCSRFRSDSELCAVNRRAGGAEVPMSSLLESAVVAALRTAEMTGGLVDLTVGGCVEQIGYTVTFGDMPAEGPALMTRVRDIPGWRTVAYDPIEHTLRLPAGTVLDLGASGKAWAADKAAGLVEDRLGVGALVECGGDVAVRGPVPDGGWPVRVAADIAADEWQDVLLRDGGLATSGTSSRRWRRGGVELHDIIDPATGLPAETPWTMVTVAAATCLEANAASTAALILGEVAVDWLDDIGLPARLVRAGGGVRYAGGWAA